MTFDSPAHERLFSALSQIALVASISLCLTFVYRVVQHTMYGNSTSSLPVERPSEKRRVFHPAGFSIIRPKFWEAKVVQDQEHPDEGDIRLWSPAHVRPGITLVISKLKREPLLLSRSEDVKFQGQPAQLALTHHPEEDFEHPGQLTAELAFERANAHWLFRCNMVRDQQSLPKRLWEYMETFSTQIPRRK